jgi:hypothetical protein
MAFSSTHRRHARLSTSTFFCFLPYHATRSTREHGVSRHMAYIRRASTRSMRRVNAALARPVFAIATTIRPFAGHIASLHFS